MSAEHRHVASQLEQMWDWPEGQPRIQRNRGSLLISKIRPRAWEAAGANARCSWIYHSPGDATAATIEASRGSYLLQGAPGLRRVLTVICGMARIATHGGEVTLMERDRIWFEKSEFYVIKPFERSVTFEVVFWPVPQNHPPSIGGVPPNGFSSPVSVIE